MRKSKAIFLGHLGLGDHIIQQGIVNQLCSEYDSVLLFCKHHNLDSLFHMCPKNVEICGVNDDNEVRMMVSTIKGRYDVFSVGIYEDRWQKFLKQNSSYSYYLGNTTFDQFFYMQANVDFSESFIDIKEGDDSQKIFASLYPERDFCFVHQDKSRGFCIDASRVTTSLPIVEPIIRSKTIFDYVRLIKMASEIHCIDSSFALMIDRLNLKCPSFVHRYVRQDSLNPTYKNMEIIN